MNTENSKSKDSILHRTTGNIPRRSVRTWLIGRPLQTADAPHQTIGKAVGLAVFASDALSSTAYATQEILIILAAASSAALGYAFPISIAIAILLLIVTLSYEQTIHAYQGGGGAYIVARDNISDLAAEIAGAALLTDYILTVAVSISSGVAQINSALPETYPHRVIISIGLVFFIMLVNLRGVKESGAFFALPTYFFIAMMFTTIGISFYKLLFGTLGTVTDPPIPFTIDVVKTVTPFLILHAFSSGTAALTGVEAISNGITAFKEPRSRNAGITLIWMSSVLGSLFLGVSFLAGKIHSVPSEFETIFSQLARTTFDGRGTLYIMMMAATTLILVLAANTSFADFPRLSALLAGDRFLPRQFSFRGSRLVFSRGIAILAILASVLIFFFKASVTALIPLYAIGVVLSFTLSQAGMAKRWWKIGRLKPGEIVKEKGSTLQYDPQWKTKLIVNGFGAICTAVVVLVFSITKFRDGAYIVIFIIPAIVIFFSSIHRHYTRLAAHLSLDNYGTPPAVKRHRVILPISGVHRGTLAALRYARTLSDDITAIHVSIDPEETMKVKTKWDLWGEGIRLVILDSPFRLLVEPLLDYIEEVSSICQPNEIITIIVPQFIPKRWYHNILHTQTAFWLRLALLLKPGIVVTDVPYQVE
jgi:amino acid transporter